MTKGYLSALEKRLPQSLSNWLFNVTIALFILDQPQIEIDFDLHTFQKYPTGNCVLISSKFVKSQAR